jgi:pSer/pThr/pTyr-binding forkhead associated (FHA) protein
MGVGGRQGTRAVAWSTVDVVFCHNCGHRNPDGVNFCSSCGNPLQADGEDITVTLRPSDEAETQEEEADVTQVEVPRGAGVLIATRGPDVGARYLLGETVVRAGRHPDSEIFLDDITVSRRHLEITPAGDGTFVVHDLGSLNGTYVNRERIDEAKLAPGDEVQIGKFKLVYVAAGGE